MDFGKIGNSHGAYRSEISTANTNPAGKISSSSLSELTPGKVFAGEVISVGKDKVLLKLDNGQTIQAGINGNVQLAEGQKLAFLVKSNTGKQLAIKPMFDVAIQNSSVLKALENAGIPVNSKSVELINLLMKEQMPIDKETIVKFLRQMTLNPDTDVKTLVQLQKMGLPATEENIARFESYQNHEYRLANEVSNVASDISKLIGENYTEQKNPLEVFGKIADIICTEQKETIENVKMAVRENTGQAVLGENQTSSFQNGPVLYDNLKSETMIHNNAENLTNIQKQALENIEAVTERFQGQETEMDHIVESLKNLNEEAEGVIRALEERSKSPQKQDMMTKLLAAFEMYETAEKSMEAAKTAMNTGEYELPKENQASRQNTEHGNVSLPETGIQGQLDENGRAVLAQKIQKAGGDVILSLQVRSGEIKPQELIRTVRQLAQEVQQEMQQLGTSGDSAQFQEKFKAVRELVQSKEFQTVLKSAIEEQLLLKPEQLTKENVKEYYEKLSQKMNQFTELMNHLGKEDTSAMKNTTAIRQNVDYMNQLNQLYSYVQLPVKLATQNTHSELYVLTKKKRLGENAGAFTALLHLDMEVLGSMDIYITMEKKKVSARFYLQREDIARFLEENSEPLIKQIEEKGFLVKAEFEKKPEEKDMVEEFAGSQSEEHVMNKYSFDIRT